MKKPLLFSLLALLCNVYSGKAQTTPVGQSSPITEWLAKLQEQQRNQGNIKARPSATVRKFAKRTDYEWNASLNRWTSAPVVSAFTYNGAAELTQVVESDSATQVPKRRLSTVYHATFKKVASFTIEGWSGNTWENTFRMVYTYDSNGKTIDKSYQAWQNGAWRNQYRDITIYNSQGLPTEETNQVWQAGSWENNYRTTFAYDAYNHVELELMQEWVNGSWKTVNGKREKVISYTAIGAPLEITSELWDANSQAFFPFLRQLLTYPSATSKEYSVNIHQLWSNGAYNNSSRMANIQRDAQQRVTYSEHEVWDNSAWRLHSRYTSTFQSNGGSQDLSEIYVQNAWMNQLRSVVTYDNYGNELSNVFEQWTNNSWAIRAANRNLLSYNSTNDVVRRANQRYDVSSQNYVNASLATYADVQNIALGIAKNTLLNGRLNIYPNPTTEILHVNFADVGSNSIDRIELYNSVGQLVLTKNMSGYGRFNNSIDLSAVQAGVYTIVFHTKDGLLVKQVVKK